MSLLSPPVSRSNGPAVGRFRWTILAALFGATTINYMDRFTLGFLKPTLVRDLHWTETDFGNVVFSFQLAYALGLLLVSRFIDKVGVKAGLAVVSILCALAAASHSLAATVAGFCVARFALGFAEAGTWPGCVKTVSEWFPPRERAIGTGLVNAGSSVGATLAPLILANLLRFVAWPFVFLFNAALNVIWCVAWVIGYQPPERHARLSAAERAYIRAEGADGTEPAPVPEPPRVSWWQLFRFRQTWGFVLAKGLSDPVWWFYLFWVPGFLAKQYGLDSGDAAATASALKYPVLAIYLIADAGSVAGGWIALRLIQRGWTVNRARKTVMLGCALCVAPVVCVSQPIGLWFSVLLIGLAAASHQAFSANLFTVATDTAPRHAVSSVAGLGGMAAAIAGMFVAKFVGYILDHTHNSYVIPFAIASGAYLVALAVLQALVPRLEPMVLKRDIA
jgi:ACS family hexuronate transporter-like MFS transporter